MGLGLKWSAATAVRTLRRILVCCLMGAEENLTFFLVQQAREAIREIFATKILRDDATLGIEQETSRQRGDIVAAGKRTLPSLEITQLQPGRVILRDADFPSRLVFVDRDRKNFKTCGMVTLIEVDVISVFEPAWSAPRRPKIH